MRALWIALLIALLPLRGWVGDAMALSMLLGGHGGAMQVADDAAPCPHAGLSVAAPADGDAAGPHADAAHDGGTPHERHAAHGDDAAHGSGVTHDHLLCDLCNGPALQAGTAGVPGEQVTPGPRALRTERFASLAPRHHHKPPIA